MNLNSTIFGQAIAFIIFVAFCMKYVWPPIIGTIEKRQKEIADSFFLIESAKKDLEIAKANAVNQLKQSQNDAQVIIEQANRSRIHILEEAKHHAEKERNRIISQAQKQIESERLRVREELRNQLASLVLNGVEKIIERSVDQTTNNDIIDKLIAKL